MEYKILNNDKNRCKYIYEINLKKILKENIIDLCYF